MSVPHKSGLQKFKGAVKVVEMNRAMNEQIIGTEADKKPRFEVTDEGEYQTNIVQEQAMSRTSNLIGKMLGRSRMNGSAYRKFCSSTDVAYQGSLQKQGSWWRNWKSRYFVLRKDMPLLAYYSSESSQDHMLGSVVLCATTSAVKVPPAEADNMPHAFRIITPRHTKKDENDNKKEVVIAETDILLCAANDADRNAWISEIMYQSATSLHPRRYQNAELNWWDLLFSHREIKSFSLSKRRKGMAANDDKPMNQTIDKDLRQIYQTAKNDSRATAPTVAASESQSGKVSHRDMDSDYSSSGDDSDDMENGLNGRTSVRSVRKLEEKFQRFFKVKVKKPKKDKKPLPPPFENVDITQFLCTYANEEEYMSARATNFKNPKKSRREVLSPEESNIPENAYTTVEGVQVCLELKNICYQNDCVFVVLCGYVHGSDGIGNKIFELGRTETITITESADYALSLPKCHLHFSLMQFNIPSYVDEIYCSVNREENGQTNDNFAPLTEAICQVRFTRNIFEMNTAFCSKMKVISKHQVDLTNPQLQEPEGKIGILRLSSSGLSVARTSIGRTLRLKPYSEIMYVFKATNGILMTLEQLFASQYSVLASKSLIKLFIKEREPFIRARLSKAKLEIQGSSGQDLTFENLALSMEEVFQRAHDDHLCDIQDVLEFYKHILRNDSGIDASNDMVISPNEGGCFLRRSTWKKQKLWQYATTNLNVHMITSNSFSDGELLERFAFDDLFDPSQASKTSDTAKESSSGGKVDADEPNKITDDQRESIATAVAGGPAPQANIAHYSFLRSVKKKSLYFNFEGVAGAPVKAAPSSVADATPVLDSSIHFVPLITLGVPSAHELGFHDGGLKRVFTNIPPERIVTWMHAIQSPDNESVIALKAAHPDDFLTIFGKNAGFDTEEHEINAMKRKYKLAKRIDVCSSQVLGFACAAVRAMLALAAQQPESIHVETLRVSLKSGWLLTLQSLLSTSGDELGMIEDLECAALWLRGTKMRFVDATLVRTHAEHTKKETLSAGEVEEDLHVAGITAWRDTTGQLVVDLDLTDPREVNVVRDSVDFWVREAAWLETPEDPMFPRGVHVDNLSLDLQQLGLGDEKISSSESVSLEPRPEKPLPVLAAINLVGAVFTIGVNEMQTVENAKARVVQGTVQAQAHINKDSLAAVTAYWAHYNKFWMRLYNFQGLHVYGERTVLATNGLFKDLEHAVRRCSANPGEKHVSVLTTVASFCRKLGGTFGILCKSGKDRTSMSSTLELTRSLVDCHNVIGGKNVVDAFRSHGARRMNVWGNTGQAMFAFNTIQRLALPECYRPPFGTFSGSVNS